VALRPDSPKTLHITNVYNAMVTPDSMLSKRREVLGLSQADVARVSGTSQPNISAYESGRRQPSTATLHRILAALDARPSRILAHFREEVLRACAKHRADNVRVFGSVALETDTSASDIDLLVRFARDATILDAAELRDELVELLGVQVDLVSERALIAGRDDDILAEARAL
jgi:predicted nucleotidyltransferase